MNGADPGTTLPPPETRPVAGDWRRRFLIGVALFVAAAALWRLQTVVRWQLTAPFDLVFESPNLATINALRHGVNVYSSSFFDAPPFVFTLYTPLYHLLCAAMPASATNPFFAGRLIAFVFMMSAVLGVLWVSKPRHWIWIILVTGLFLLLHPVSSNLVFLKNDGTALFFSVLAILIVSKAPRTHLRLAAAALSCVLAIASKQVFVAASAACFVYLLLEQRRDALRFGGYYLLFAAVAAALAQALWGNGFWWCVFHAPRMPFSADQFITQWRLMLRQPVFLLLFAAWIVTAAEYLYRRRGRSLNPFLIYFLCSGVVLLLTVGKPGSSTNYFIEWSLAGVLWLVSILPSSLPQKINPALLAGLCLAVTLCELATATPRDFALGDPGFIAVRQQLHEALTQEAKSLAPRADPLRVLNFAGASTFFDWPGKTSVNDPYLYTLLWEHGILKPDAMIRELHSQQYQLVVFRSDAVLAPSDRADGMGQIMKSLRESYRLAGYGVFLQYWVPLTAAKD